MKATFVLIHGAWHGRWCWELLIPMLESRGCRVVAPDLPGMGNDPTPLETVSIESWAWFVADLVRDQCEPVILVGHSRAGLIISRAAELEPDCVSGLVYLASFLVGDGQTLEQVMRQIEPRAEAAGALELSPDGAFSRIAPDAMQRVFYNSSPAELVERARLMSGPEPMTSFTTPLRVSDARWGRVPRFYIECEQDRAIAPELQRRMQAQMPCRRTFRMNSDHSPFYSAPAELAEHLVAIAEQLQRDRDRTPLQTGGGAVPSSRSLP